MGSNNSIQFTINNDTKFDIVGSKAYNFDKYDWEHETGLFRVPTTRYVFAMQIDYHTPDRKLNNLKIEHDDSFTCTLNIHKGASNCPFTLSLTFSDNSEDIVRITAQKIRSGDPDDNPLENISIYHKISYDVGAAGKGYKFQIIIEHTDDQLIDMKIDEAKKKRDRKRWEQALQDLKEASDIATTDEQKQRINKCAATVYAAQAKNLENEGLGLELDPDHDNSIKVDIIFLQVITGLEQAIALDAKTEYITDLARIKEKRAGNDLFNQANETQKRAYELFIKGDYEGAQRLYQQSKQMMQQAAQKFEVCLKGNTRYQDCLNVVREEVIAIQETTQDLQVLQLKQHMEKLQVDEDRNKETLTVEEDIRLV